MSDPNFTALLLIVDRSGSMTPIADAMSGAMSKLLKEQAALPGLTTVDMILFDHEMVRTHHLADPAQVQIELIPRGGTALYDAVGLAVFDFAAYIHSLPEHARPATVQVVIVTDGEDTASVEYSPEAVQALVQPREAEGWLFLFLGGDLDAEQAAEDLGTARANSIAFERSDASVRGALAQTSHRMAEGRPTRPSTAT